ncbi:unnamed protein product [Phyllotreta striolata]|uniref:Uncharacterized protein n=1 Tax=Phyllotreta striolata TaxID=444603 RepID=A0A9P0DQ50_PHYSR|nr:unnamed protein product [Phyllotreta striolata]
MAQFNRWTFIKLLEVILVLVCVIFKRVTDDESSRVFLYLQKLSREWHLLNNITWSRVGAAVADTAYGGYLIITGALFFAHLFGELPTTTRIFEYIVLGIGTILFIVLGSLSFAAIDSVPHNLIDNAAIVGTVSLVVAALFLLDIGGPKRRTPKQTAAKLKKPPDSKVITKQVYEAEKRKKDERKASAPEMQFVPKKAEKNERNGVTTMEMQTMNNGGYQRMHDSRDDSFRRFGIYGQDVTDEGATTDAEDIEMPPKMEPHSPIWSNIRKGQYGKSDIVNPKLMLQRSDFPEDFRPPSSPGDPGYVQYTAQHWGQSGARTPRHSPTQV